MQRSAVRPGFLYRKDGEPRLVVPGLVALATTIAIAWGIAMLVRHPQSEDDRADALAHNGRFEAAEAIYVDLLRQEPTVPHALEFLRNHDRGARGDRSHLSKGTDDLEHRAILEKSPGMMPEDAVERVLAGLPDDVSLVARFVRADGFAAADLRGAIESGAKRVPPAPWCNHVLAAEALRDGRSADAADLFEREGTAFRDRAEDVDMALDLWIDLDDWDKVRDRMGDARVRARAAPETKARIAIHERDWRGAAKWTALGYRSRLAPWSVAMSAVGALAWGLFCFRLGRFGERPRRRLAFYVAAFVLGVLSICPTVLLISVEEAKLHLVETGDAGRDILFFIFGVGLREEASKLLLFAALLPFLRKWGDKLDVLVCGALVGLGFAAEENLGYLASGDLQTGIGRFLTANFFHMAMTGTLAAALDDLVESPEENSQEFSRTALMVIGMHGAYDFLLSHAEYGGSYLAMSVFFFLTRLFLGALDRARRKFDKGLSPLHAFVFAAAVVTGVSAVHASLTIGPLPAAAAMGMGLMGEAIIFFVFIRALRGM
jgi:RsiW-degrading membrane proteinase PrsW (M82 family)